MKKFLSGLLLGMGACTFTPEIELPEVPAKVETEAVIASESADAADDPALWVNPLDPNQSLVFGSNKVYGIETFDLSGKKLASYEVGRVNNIDIRYKFPLNDSVSLDILAGTERNHNEILVFQIASKDGALQELSGGISSNQPEVYGFCLYKSPFSGEYFAFLNDKSGAIEQWKLYAEQDSIRGELVRTFSVATQPEGMVADDKLGHLYVGEEGTGIWRFDAEPQSQSAPIFLEMSGYENPNIRFDVEGLAIYRTPTDSLLLASSQGNNSYAVFALDAPYPYLGSFRIADTQVVDGTEDTDGIEVYSGNLGSAFPHGVFISQDGYNLLEDGKKGTQNFKLVAWESIANSLGKNL